MRIVHFDSTCWRPAVRGRPKTGSMGWTDGVLDGQDGGRTRHRRRADAADGAGPGADQRRRRAVGRRRDRRIVQAGGTVVAPKMAVPGVGWTAYFADPEGNAFGVMEFDPAAA